VKVGVEEHSLTPEDQLFILMQAGLYLTATRGLGAPEARICYERAEPLSNSLNRPLSLYVALMGQWRYSIQTDKSISIAKELNDMNGLAFALAWASGLGCVERDPAAVDRMASDLIELSTHHNFVYWLAIGAIYRGWARSASGNTTEGIPWIEGGIRDARATGSLLSIPQFVAQKAEALYLAGLTSEALGAINEAEALVAKFEQRYYDPELRRLRSIFLVALGAEATQIEASFSEAIRIAEDQRSVSLGKRAKASYAEYRRQKASGPGGRGFRLPL
jgi:hypothetical protein